MPIPLSNRPKITPQSILDGYVMRYFVQLVLDKNRVIEIDEKQYNTFKSDKRYTVTRFPWLISGNAFDYVAPNGAVIQGTQTKNANIVTFYSKQIPNLDRYLPNKLEFFQGVNNTPITPINISIPVSAQPTEEIQQETAVATAITLDPTSLTFNYQIGSTTPNSQSISITADGTLSGLSISSGSSWVSASLVGTSAPTTVWIYPIITGFYSGSYSSTVTVSSTQTGITSKQVAVALNVTNSPDVLFIYAPGMSFGSSSFSRSSIATYNEVV